jgi:homoserine acetyltransferase
MDQVIADIITQVPLAVVVLLIAWRMAAKITDREEARDQQQSALETQRETARREAQTAQDRQMDRLLQLQADQQALQRDTNKALEALNATRQIDIKQSADRYVALHDTLIPVAEAVPGIKSDLAAILSAIGRIEKGQEALAATTQTLADCESVPPEAFQTLTNEVRALASSVDDLRRLLPPNPQPIE